MAPVNQLPADLEVQRPSVMKSTINHFKSTKAQHGSAMAFFAISLPILMLVLGGAFYFATYGIVKEQTDGTLKLVLLAAAERYSEYPVRGSSDDASGGAVCRGVVDRLACHNLKLAAAVEKANEVARRQSNKLGTLLITSGTLDDAPANSGEAILMAERHTFVKLDENNKPDANLGACEQDCFFEKPNNEFANGFRIHAKMERNTLLNKIVNSFGLSLDTDVGDKIFTAAAIPLRFVAAVDLSSSITWDTHEFGCDFSAYHSDNAGTVAAEYAPLWDPVPETRGAETSGKMHFKDDYRVVETFNDSIDDYIAYDQTFDGIPANEYHVDPEDPMFADSGQFEAAVPAESDPSLGLSELSGDGTYYNFLLDMYRGNQLEPPYRGPEPWHSIYRAVAKSMELFKDRAVAGDRAGLIFYHSGISWRMGVKLTDNFDYIRDLLGEKDGVDPLVEEITKNDLMTDGADGLIPWPTGPSDFGNTMPRWVRLGLFPVPGVQTNTPLAITAAANFFSQDDLAGAGVPSVDFIGHFGDGLPTCFRDGSGEIQCDGRQYDAYRYGITQIRDFAARTLYQNKIVLHKFLFGAHVGPHTILRPNDEGTGCMTEQEARGQIPPIDFVKGTDGIPDLKTATLTSEQRETANEAFDEMFEYVREKYPDSRCRVEDADPSAEEDPSVEPIEEEEEEDSLEPFYQANTDWYQIVRLTGGRWFPIRPFDDSESCTPTTPTCPAGSPPRRLEVDPECRNVEAQVTHYLEDLIMTGGGYVIVESN